MRLLFLLLRLLAFSSRLRAPQSNYERYLASPHWRYVRGLALRRDGYRCQRCRARSGLQVHHRTYAHLGHEEAHLSDLQTLCQRHHRMEHRRYC
jgi:hypothetical protein